MAAESSGYRFTPLAASAIAFTAEGRGGNGASFDANLMTSPMAYFAATDSADRPGTYSGIRSSAARVRIMRSLSRITSLQPGSGFASVESAGAPLLEQHVVLADARWTSRSHELAGPTSKSHPSRWYMSSQTP